MEGTPRAGRTPLGDKCAAAWERAIGLSRTRATTYATARIGNCHLLPLYCHNGPERLGTTVQVRACSVDWMRRFNLLQKWSLLCQSCAQPARSATPRRNRPKWQEWQVFRMLLLPIGDARKLSKAKYLTVLRRPVLPARTAISVIHC